MRRTALALILGVVGLGATVFWYRSIYRGTEVQSVSSVSATTSSIQIPDWHKPVSSRQGYPVVSTNDHFIDTLSVYSFSSRTSRIVANDIKNPGSSMGLGSQAPLASPNYFYTVYVKGSALHLVSNDTAEDTTIASTSAANMIYISGWSPDSKKLVFAVTVQPSEGMNFMQRARAAEAGLDTGMYLVDIDAGSIEKLPFDQGFESFIDSDRCLVYVNDNTDLAVYDLRTRTTQRIEGQIPGRDIGQISFSNDGATWVFVHGDPVDGVKITYATFPAYTGTVIDFGQWAEIQWPVISPNKKYVAYKKDKHIEIADIESGSKRSFLRLSEVGIFDNISPERWIDDNRLIVSMGTLSPNWNYSSILHVDSGQIEIMR